MLTFLTISIEDRSITDMCSIIFSVHGS